MKHFRVVNDKLPKEQPKRLILQVIIWPIFYAGSLVLLPLTLALLLLAGDEKKVNFKQKNWNYTYNVILLVIALFLTPLWVGAVSAPSVDTPPQEPSVIEEAEPESEPVVEVKQEKETVSVKCKTVEKNDNNLEQGTKKVIQDCKNGERTITYKVTYTDGEETSRTKVSDKVTTQPVDKVVHVGTYVTPEPEPECHPSYTGACVPFASDVDCLGGSGDGPAYVRGPVNVVGPDVYRLDGDGDGVACE